MEIFDIVDSDGIPTGRTVSRREAHAKGIPHRTAHVWIIREHHGRTEVLLQKRAAVKDSFPGCWDTSSAGHIPAGDEPKHSALRELCEELGISAETDSLKEAGSFHIRFTGVFHGEVFNDDETAFVYIYEEPVDVSDLKLQEEEVSEVRWFALDEVYERILKKDPDICADQSGVECLIAWLKQNH